MLKSKPWFLFVLGCAMLLLLSGCYIAALHPLADQNDRIFDANLTGSWAHGRDTLKFVGQDVDNLHLEVTEGPGPLNDTIRQGGLDLLCTRIGNRTYMDIQPGDLLKSEFPTMKAMLLVPMHAFMRYSVTKDSLIVYGLNYKEFNDKMRRGKWHGLDMEPVQDDGPLLITSPTAKIRKFLLKNEDDRIFAEPVAYSRVR